VIEPPALVALLFCLTLPGGSLAEVAAIPGDPVGADITSVISMCITDDGDPVLAIWQPISPAESGRIVLNPQGHQNGDGPPSILRGTTSGRPLVAWARNSVAGYDVVLSRFENGAWTAPEVLAGSTADELDPWLIESPAGEIYLFYWVREEGVSSVFQRHAPADLPEWSAAEPISPPGKLASRPRAVFHDDVLYVAYEIDRGEGVPKDVALARQEGSAYLIEVLATSYNTGALWPTPHSRSGRFWVDWIDVTFGDEHHGEMAWLRQDPQGQWEVSRYESFASEEQRDYHVRGEIRHQALTLP
jgi:hypothetical protein